MKKLILNQESHRLLNLQLNKQTLIQLNGGKKKPDQPQDPTSNDSCGCPTPACPATFSCDSKCA